MIGWLLQNPEWGKSVLESYIVLCYFGADFRFSCAGTMNYWLLFRPNTVYIVTRWPGVPVFETFWLIYLTLSDLLTQPERGKEIGLIICDIFICGWYIEITSLLSIFLSITLFIHLSVWPSHFHVFAWVGSTRYLELLLLLVFIRWKQFNFPQNS